MQDDNLLQNTFLVQAGVVGGAMLLLLIIIAYLHFDEKISNFFGNCQKGYAKMVKTTKAKVRHRVVRTQKSAKARVMTKLKMIRAFQIGDKNNQNSDGRAKSGMSISVISKATMDQESNDTNPQIQNPNPGNPKSQPDGLTTSCLADPALSSLPNGFQSKV